MHLTRPRAPPRNSGLREPHRSRARYPSTTPKWTAAKANAGAEVTALEQTLANELQQLQRLKSQLKHCQADVESATLNLRREQARLQRLNIERRNLEQSIEQTPEMSSKLEALGRQAQSLALPIEAAERALGASRTALQHIDSSTERSQQHVQELERLKNTQIRSQSLRLREVSSLSDDALTQRNEALADLGRAILTENGRIAVEARLLTTLRKHDEDIGVIWLRHQIFLLALDRYHRDSVKNGFVLAISSAVLFLVGLLWRMFT